MIPLSSMSAGLPRSNRFSPGRSHRPRGRTRRVPLLRATLFSLSLLLIASALPSGAQQFTFRHYGQDDGLRNLDVFSMVEDTDGALLMATENGVFRYDGAGFQQIGQEQGLGEQLVLGIYKDAFHRIWITTHDHLYQYLNGRAIAVPMSEADSYFAPGQTIVALDESRLLVLTRGTLHLLTRSGKQSQDWTAADFFTPSQIAAHPEFSLIHSALLAGNGDLWLGCSTSICRIAKPGSERAAATAGVEVFGVSRGIPAQAWSHLFEDREHNLWARSGQAIRSLSPGSNEFRDRDIPGGLTPYNGSGLLAFAQDRNGNVLTQTNHGIARWERDHWRHFDAANGIVVKDISTILIDHTGNPWFATRGHGIYRWLGYGVIENWASAQGMGDDVAWPIFRDSRGRLWLSDQFQLGILDETTHRIAPPPLFARSPFPHATSFAESPDGSLWFLRIGGEVVRTDPEVRRITFRIKLPVLSRSFTDSEGRLWIMSRNGLFVVRDLSKTNPQVEKIESPLLLDEAFADAAESSNHDLWFLADRHLYRLSHTDGNYTRIDLDAAATRGQMRGIAAAPDGTLWIGGGIPALLHLRVEGNQAKIIDSITPPVLASTVVQTVRFGTNGRLWIGTDQGINVFDGRSWHRISQRDGLISNDTDEGAFFAEKDGSVWFGLNGGAAHVLHPERFFTPSPLDIHITSATLGGKPLSLTSLTRTRWQDDPLDVTFTSFDLARDNSLRFRYRLAGLESRWNQTSAHVMHYPAVPPGDYRFEIQASDPDRNWKSPVTSFSFTIRPPWWRTRPFYALLCLLTFLASVLLWNWRERRLIRRQRRLRHLVAQRTRELEAEKSELLAAREALRQQATRDALTGLWNRPAILDILVREMDRAHRTGTTLAVVLADIDHFKQINDTLGHLAGDEILREAANRMLHNLRPYDFIGRYGGEEFLIVLPGLPYQDPHARLTYLQQAISGSTFTFEGHTVRVTSSFGGAWLNPTITVVEDLVRRADEALYQAKARGRDRIVFYSEGQWDGQPSDQLTT